VRETGREGTERHRAAQRGKRMARNRQIEPEPLVYTQTEAAELLKISVRTVRNLLRRGELTGVKICRRTLIPATSLEVFLKRGIQKWESRNRCFGASAERETV
jgi:excisionase family DNA binding protein